MLDAFLALLDLQIVALSALGVLLGVVVGAMPGLNGGMLMALTLPLTFFMAPLDAQVLLIAMYVGDVSGGMIAATLMGVAGTPAAIMTTLDANAMARQGLASKALAIGIGASFAGSMLSWLVLAFAAEPLARLGLQFGPFETFALVVAGLVMIAAVGDKSFLLAILAGVIGMLASLVGLDPVDAQPRLTFGISHLQNGFATIPVLLGIFAIAPVLADLIMPERRSDGRAHSASLPLVARHLGTVLKHPVTLIRSSVIGTVIGILPGIGAAIGSTVSYAVARMSDRNPERFGKGAEEGVVASEAGNNATVAGALVPMISLGIPGSPADVILLAALMIHAIQPGPLLVVERPDIFFGVIASALLAMMLMLPIMLLASAGLSNVMRIPRNLLTVLVIALCMLGTYVSGKTVADLWVLLGFSVLGLLMLLNRLSLPAFVIGFILGPMAESALRTGLMSSRGSLLPLVQRPIPLILLFAAAAMIAWVFWRSRARRA